MSDHRPAPSDDDLGAALVDLGRHLVPATDDERFTGDVLARLTELEPRAASGLRRRRPEPRRWVAAAVAAVVAVLAVVAIAPARDAVARWLGIGGVQITPTGDPPVVPATTGGTGPSPGAVIDLDAIARDVGFEPRLADPALVGPLLGAQADPAAPSGLVELRYREVTVVQLAARADRRPALDKLVGPGTTITPVAVGGVAGLWLAGAPHAVALVDADGTTLVDRVRRAGNVLVWERDGITTRVEGAPSLEVAQAIAASLR